MTARISIALATYNGEKYLAEQLQSFCAQTKLPDELIVCDDCSTDTTLNILYDFFERAPFTVKVFVNSENQGYTKNFAKALELCTGDIVFLSDQDDVWLPPKIDKIIQYFELNPDTQLVIHDLDYCKDDLTPIGQTKIERMENVFDLNHWYVVGMATAIRSSFLKLCLPIPNLNGLTHDLWIHRCAAAIETKIVIRESLALYRRHTQNVTHGDKLNVAYVTKSNHFKNNLLTKIKNVNQLKSTLEYLLDQPFIRWMEDNKASLYDKNLIKPAVLEYYIQNELNKQESIRIRCNILSLSRIQRIYPIFQLYQKGEYDYFDGLRTALGDFLPSKT
jgi:glycosyltransferase involved in cell wall biosynthesis